MRYYVLSSEFYFENVYVLTCTIKHSLFCFEGELKGFKAWLEEDVAGETKSSDFPQ